MKSQVIFDATGRKENQKMERRTQYLILSYINRHLQNTHDPQASGKALAALCGVIEQEIIIYETALKTANS